jgi:predicted metal-dependent peptidase
MKDSKDILIVFTDGEFNHDLNYHNVNLIWVLSQPYTVKYGKKIVLEK